MHVNSAGRCADTKALSTMKSLKAGLSNVKAAGFNAYKAANEAVRPAQKESSFTADGVRVLLCQKLLSKCVELQIRQVTTGRLWAPFRAATDAQRIRDSWRFSCADIPHMGMVSWVQWRGAHLEHGLMRSRFPLHVVARRVPVSYREAGDPLKAKPYLPDTQKQYLITRNGAWKRPVCVTGDVAHRAHPR